MPDKLLSTNALSYIKDNFLKTSGGTIAGTLYLNAVGATNGCSISQDGDVNSGLQIASYSRLRNVREFTICHPQTANTWTHLQFRTSSFPYGGDIGIASEEWVNAQKASVQDIESLRGGVIKFIIKKVLGGLCYAK